MLLRNEVQLAGRAAGDLRRHNRAVVLELVRTQGPISRAALARTGHLSMPAVMDIVSGLLDEGLIQEIGVGPSSGGRRPVLLELVPQAYCAIGLEVGARTLRAVVTDLHATVTQRINVPSEMERGPEALLEQVRHVLDEILAQHIASFGGVLGIGLALPAPVLNSASMSFSPPSYPGWGQLQLGELMADGYGIPVLVDNDANAAALGELLYGAGRGVRNMFYVLVDRGIGGAAIVDGQLYRGSDGGAGELGHMFIDPESPMCGCGRYGCLQAIVGRASIAQRAQRALKLAGFAELDGQPVADIGTDAVITAAQNGVEHMRTVLTESGNYLGIGIANVVNLLNPELVVLGGSTMRAGDLVLQPVIEVVQRRAFTNMAAKLPIVVGHLGEDASAVGAAALVLRELFVQGNR